MLRFLLFTSLLAIVLSSSAQSDIEPQYAISDSLSSDSIEFTPAAASAYIMDLLKMDGLWKTEDEPMKLSMARLVDHYSEPFDSVGNRLSAFNFDSIRLHPVAFIHYDTIPLNWLNDSTFIVDTLELDRGFFREEITIIEKPLEHSENDFNANLPELYELPDSISPAQDTINEVHLDSVSRDLIVYENDTIREVFIDTVFLNSMNIQLYTIENRQASPPLLSPSSLRAVHFLPDSGKIVYSDTTHAIIADSLSPFYIVPNMKLTDSLKFAVEELISYTTERDSIPIFINDINGRKTPFWLGLGNEGMFRYWVKNFKNDSITIWVGNPSRNNISVFLEDDININRLSKWTVEDVPFTLAKPKTSLVKLEPLTKIPEYWEYKVSSTFAFNQTHLSNWAKGGESSISSVLDLKGEANYIDPKSKTKWISSGRLKYGSIITSENGLRTNTDMIELNSQYNKVINKNLDFSTIFYMKNQMARGYNYPNDSVVVSKFMNPVTFTIGIGVEYKLFKHTKINSSPLSYKNTFVLDTAAIDQTNHGIDADKRVKQEMGGQVLIKSKIDVMKNLEVSNSIRLFTNYFDHPQNIDLDWEIYIKRRITWYFTVAANLHMIYDDNIRFPVLNENEEPITLADGSVKKVAKLQFKEFIGLSFSFNF